MRIAVLVALAAVAVACGGETVSDPSGKSASDEQAGATTPTQNDSAESSTSGNVPVVDGGAATGACFRADGPPAPGECTVGDQRNCPADLADAGPGTFTEGPAGFCEQRCINVDGTATWSEPTRYAECAYYDTDLYIGANNPACACNTPLVLSFDDAPVVFDATATGSFDLTRLGVSHGSDWPTAATPWLALDRNGNGAIDDGGELFGSATRLADGGYAKNGFDALRDLDDNKDGVFDARDAAFAKILVWSDRNHDKASTPSELTTLAERGVTSISLHDRNDPRCDARGNCEGERASFTFDGRRGTVVDVYLPSR